ncbi:DNA topoisomerase III [Longirhabdus pacifica]|uniref:DNA topoisomerase III n=1 Tax=Longirhabdus pacifica TaxID=2305227 RepID=UPI001008AF28|nr:DNA topoisomerase III [Longirhabdus pacifica]
MSKIVVLAEKPSVARDIARVLHCHQKGNGFLEGKQYIVTWALGHLVTLADPEVYDDKYKTWKLEDLPMLPSKLQLVIIKKTAKQYHAVKSQLLRNDVKKIVIATDAGREGELVARWIIEKAKVKKPLERLWISSVTDKAIQDGFKKLKNGKAYDNLYASAVARSEADWLVGMNATRALTCKHNAQLSCGRVQTPTLAMIAKREEEINNFTPLPYYGITAVSDKLKLTWQSKTTQDIRIFDKQKCENIMGSIQHKDAKIIEVKKAHKKNYAPSLYDLTELQRDANKLYGFSAKETLSIMQKLYEQHKVLTYPRTDSRHLSSDIVSTLGDRLKACSVKPYASFTANVLKKPIKLGKAVVDDSKVSDHHAIIPTEQVVQMGKLNEQERKIYDLVVKRFIAVFYPATEYEQTVVHAQIGEEVFIAKGKRILSQGWKAIYGNIIEEEDDEQSKEQLLPELKQGDDLRIASMIQTEGKTKPPKPFNEATLLSAMENPSKYMVGTDQKLIKTIGKTGGLGTVATRADIIEKLFNSFTIEKKGKDIYLTSKGKQLLALVPEELKSPALTAEWELKLEQIAKGTLQKQTFVKDMRQYAQKAVSEVKQSKQQFKHDNVTHKRCPECNKPLLEVNGKKGKMHVCQDRDCGFRKKISILSNARCPNCHKKMELRGEGEGQIFVCSCSYREKLSAFQKRKGEQKNNVSKKEVSTFLKKQNKDNDEPMNTALADALAKFKFDK